MTNSVTTIYITATNYAKLSLWWPNDFSPTALYLQANIE